MKHMGEFLLAFSWITAFNPDSIPKLLSCLASIMAIASYFYNIKKQKNGK